MLCGGVLVWAGGVSVIIEATVVGFVFGGCLGFCQRLLRMCGNGDGVGVWGGGLYRERLWYDVGPEIA